MNIYITPMLNMLHTLMNNALICRISGVVNDTSNTVQLCVLSLELKRGKVSRNTSRMKDKN